MNDIVKRENTLFERISYLIEQARKRVSTTVNLAEVYTKYSIGQYIVEDEQQGEYRAQYRLVENLFLASGQNENSGRGCRNKILQCLHITILPGFRPFLHCCSILLPRIRFQ